MRYEIEAAQLASERAARTLRHEMGRGRATLATIASTAASVGIVGTTIVVVTSFKGCPCGSDYTFAAAIAKSIGDGLAPTAWGLVIAVLASWSYRYLCIKLEEFDAEMRVATLDLANCLGQCNRVDR